MKRKRLRGRTIIFLVLITMGILAGTLWWLTGRGKPMTDTFLQDLGPGWNMGNALDAHMEGLDSSDPSDHETLWGNPPASEALFQTVRQGGFRTVRIPVTWYPHMDENGKVDDLWMNRVQQVVDDALNSDLYVILNVHHDNWYSPFDEGMDTARERLAILWEQIAQRFSGYDERLIFESMNEPRLIGHDEEWTVGTPEALENVNELNQLFVDTVRGTGGGNTLRYLLVPSYAASQRKEVLEAFRMPEGERLGLSVHMYLPYEFCHIEDGGDRWSEENTLDTVAIKAVLHNLRRIMIDEGIPVVITEYGALNKNNPDDRARWAKYLVRQADQHWIPCIWWDNGGPSAENSFSLLDRNTLQWYDQTLLDAVGSSRGNK